MKPKRIQRKRTKGWKMPEGAVYVGRPTKWGNPYKVIKGSDVWSAEGVVSYYRGMVKSFMEYGYLGVKLWDLDELRGKDLACWCPLDQPCHADVLLEIANS